MTLRGRALPALDPARIASSAAIGGGAAVAGALLRLALAGYLGQALPFLTFYPAVAVAAWAAGLGGGLMAIAGSMVLTIVLTDPSARGSTENVVGGLVFIGGGALISWLGHAMRTARADAETARDRARFVAEAARLLHEPIERDTTLEALSHVVVPRFADWCAIDLFDADLRFTGAVVVAPDPTKRALALELRAAYPYTTDAPAGVAWVARTGRPEFALDLPAGFFAQIPDPRLRALMDGLGFRAYISVPMTAPTGRTLGVLSFVMAESGRRFTTVDVDLASDLARRTAVALEHVDLLRQAQERRDLLEAVIAAIPEAVLLADAQGRVELENAAAVEAIGVVTGRRLADVIASLQPAPARDDLLVASTGRFVAPRVIETDVDGAPVRFAMLADRTDLVETEAARDAFVSMLSHELRTPITTIYGSAQLLRRDPPAAVRSELLEELASETDRLLHLVEDLLVLSRFERGRLDAALEPVMIARVIEAAVTAEALAHPRLRVAIEAAPSLPPVLGDVTYLRQVVRNLVSNAVKYAGATPGITVRLLARGARVRIEFEDDGPGIAPDRAEHVFDLFERLPTREPKPGAGIGLFVCRQLATVMGGTMTLERRDGPGACFVLELPALAADAEPGDDAAPPDRTGIGTPTGG